MHIYIYACTFSDVYVCMYLYLCRYMCLYICAYTFSDFKTLLVTAEKITFKVTYHKVHD